EARIGLVAVAVVEEDDPPPRSDEPRGRVDAPRAGADDDDVGHARPARAAARWSTTPTAARNTAAVPETASRATRRSGCTLRGRNSSANAGEVSRIALMTRILLRRSPPGWTSPSAASRKPALQGWRRAKRTMAASAGETARTKSVRLASRERATSSGGGIRPTR